MLVTYGTWCTRLVWSARKITIYGNIIPKLTKNVWHTSDTRCTCRPVMHDKCQKVHSTIGCVTRDCAPSPVHTVCTSSQPQVRLLMLNMFIKSIWCLISRAKLIWNHLVIYNLENTSFWSVWIIYTAALGAQVNMILCQESRTWRYVPYCYHPCRHHAISLTKLNCWALHSRNRHLG
jgi:hypothetical protein